MGAMTAVDTLLCPVRCPKEGGKEKAAASRARRKAERAASRLDYADGSTIYKDSGQGRGWVLERPRESRRYFQKLENAIARLERGRPAEAAKLETKEKP